MNDNNIVKLHEVPNKMSIYQEEEIYDNIDNNLENNQLIENTKKLESEYKNALEEFNKQVEENTNNETELNPLEETTDEKSTSRINNINNELKSNGYYERETQADKVFSIVAAIIDSIMNNTSKK